MGMDIHIHVIRGTEVVREDIFDGRNSEWFNNLMGRGDDDEYDYLPVSYGLPDVKPEVVDGYTLSEMKENKDGYFGFRYISVKDFKKWFDAYRPDKKAGWVTTYEKWQWEKQGVEPRDPRRYLDKDDIIEDMHFIEFDKTYDCSKWLYEYIIKNSIIWDNSYIIYWFDC